MIGMAQGLVTTFKHLLRPAITLRYPYEKRPLTERSRTSFMLPMNESGTVACKSCGMCAKSCPVSAIVIESEKKTDGPGRVLTKFTIDLGKCMYCGMCVEYCPSLGLAHTGDYETATHHKGDTILVLFNASTGASLEESEGAGDETEPARKQAVTTDTAAVETVAASAGLAEGAS